MELAPKDFNLKAYFELDAKELRYSRFHFTSPVYTKTHEGLPS